MAVDYTREARLAAALTTRRARLDKLGPDAGEAMRRYQTLVAAGTPLRLRPGFAYRSTAPAGYVSDRKLPPVLSARQRLGSSAQEEQLSASR